MEKEFQSFKEFYPFYLSQHQNVWCQRFHFLGLMLVLLVAAYAIYDMQFFLIFILPAIGYSFAWIGHYFFEKNKPATFTYPLYSFMGDWIMFKDILIGKIKIF